MDLSNKNNRCKECKAGKDSRSNARGCCDNNDYIFAETGFQPHGTVCSEPFDLLNWFPQRKISFSPYYSSLYRVIVTILLTWHTWAHHAISVLKKLGIFIKLVTLITDFLEPKVCLLLRRPLAFTKIHVIAQTRSWGTSLDACPSFSSFSPTSQFSLGSILYICLESVWSLLPCMTITNTCGFSAAIRWYKPSALPSIDWKSMP